MNHSVHFKRQKPRIISNLDSQTKRQQIKSFSSNKKIYQSSEKQQKNNKIILNDIYKKNNSKSKRVYMTYNQSQNFLSASINYKKNKIFTIGDAKGDDQIIKNNQNSLKKAKSNASNNKYGKQQKKLSIQFQKQLYWNANSEYLVTGVKLQYQKYKQLYEQKCNELNALQINLKKNSIQELKEYIAVLQSQSKKNYQRYIKIKGRKQVKSIIIQNQEKNQEIILQTLMRLQREQTKNKTLQQSNHKIKNQNRNLKKQIKLVQKLLIQKQNAQFNALSKMRRSQKKQKQLKQKITQLQNRLQYQVQNGQKSLKSTTDNIKQIHAQQLNYLSLKLRKSQSQVQKLYKQNTYLKDLLQYWQKNPDQYKNQQANYQYKNGQKVKHSNNKQGKTSIVFSNDKQQSKLEQKQFENKNQKKFNRKQQQSNQNSIKSENYEIQRQFNTFQINGKYKKKSAAIKTQNSVKNRRIQFFQIEGLVELINYRLAYKKIQKKQIKSFFKFKFEENNLQRSSQEGKKLLKDPLTTQKLYQKGQLITMKQIKQIFKQQPFKLNQSQANTLARYFVEDVVEQFIYTHQQNSIQRAVAQSIATNLFSKYTILKVDTLQKCETHLKQFKANILGGFKYQTKNGLVSRQKFKDIMMGLGLKGDQEMTDYMLSKMCCVSQSLQSLNYNALYDQTNNLSQN